MLLEVEDACNKVWLLGSLRSTDYKASYWIGSDEAGVMCCKSKIAVDV